MSHDRSREEEMKIIHNDMQDMLDLILKISQKEFMVGPKDGHHWNCFPPVASYHFDVPEWKLAVHGMLRQLQSHAEDL